MTSLLARGWAHVGKDRKKSKKNTSLRLDGDMLKALKRQAVEEDTSVQRIVERLIAGYLQGTSGRKGAE